MTDLEITRLCAKAMRIAVYSLKESEEMYATPCVAMKVQRGIYEPLLNDAQAMALVKKLGLTCIFELGQGRESWNVQHWRDGIARNGNLNRAICECAAKMQAAKC